MVKVDGVADEGGVMDEAEARPALWHFAPEQQLFAQLHVKVAGLKHSGVPQTVDYDDVVVELAEGLPADVKGLLPSAFKIRGFNINKDEMALELLQVCCDSSDLHQYITYNRPNFDPSVFSPT